MIKYDKKIVEGSIVISKLEPNKVFSVVEVIKRKNVNPLLVLTSKLENNVRLDAGHCRRLTKVGILKDFQKSVADASERCNNLLQILEDGKL